MTATFVLYNSITNPDNISSILTHFSAHATLKIGNITINRSKSMKLFSRKGMCCIECDTNVIAADIMLDKRHGTYFIQLMCSNNYPLTMDHIVPKSLGGYDELDNLVPMCYECNCAKGSELIIDCTSPGLLMYVAKIKILITIYKAHSNITKLSSKQLKQLRHIVTSAFLSDNDKCDTKLCKLAYAIGMYELKHNMLINSLNQSKII